MVSGMSPDALSQSVLARFGLRWQLGMVFLFNSAIGLLLIAVFGDRFGPATPWLSVAYSHAIGFSIHGAVHLLALLAKRPRRPTPGDLIGGVLIGATAGTLFGGVATGTWAGLLERGWSGVGLNILLGIVFGSVAGYVYFTTVRNAQTRVMLKEKELRRLTAEKALTDTRLRLLQAQIEPHFLFNTLSNIHGLIESHPERAGRMLESLIHYLRATLQHTREGRTTLGDELELVRAYLAIQQERMGARLRWHIEAPKALLDQALPPMLIQPLVENAVTHGLEPALEGGSIEVAVTPETEHLVITVTDTAGGAGSRSEGAGFGLGLVNIKARLETLYGDRASVTLETRQPCGARASLILPRSTEREDDGPTNRRGETV